MATPRAFWTSAPSPPPRVAKLVIMNEGCGIGAGLSVDPSGCFAKAVKCTTLRDITYSDGGSRSRFTIEENRDLIPKFRIVPALLRINFNSSISARIGFL